MQELLVTFNKIFRKYFILFGVEFYFKISF